MIFLLTIESESDRDKLVTIYYLYKKIILAIAFDILKDYHEAVDVLQSVIMKVSYNLNGIKDVSSQNTKGLIIQITRNYCYDVYRKKQKLVIGSEFSDLDIGYVEESYSFEATLDKQMFSDLMKNLKKEYAEILTLKHYHELSVKEITKKKKAIFFFINLENIILNIS